MKYADPIRSLTSINEVLSPIGLELSDEGVISTVQGKVRRQISPQDTGVIRGIQGGEGAQNAQQFIAANNIIRGLTPGQDDQERGVVFDPDAVGDAVGDAVESAIVESLVGSEAGAAGAAAAAESQRRAESSILDTNVGRARLDLGRNRQTKAILNLIDKH